MTNFTGLIFRNASRFQNYLKSDYMILKWSL